MTQKTARLTGYSLLATTLLTALAISGCFFGGSSGGSSDNTDSSDSAWTGELTFTNNSGQPVCGVEFVQPDITTSHMDRLENGQSATIQIQDTVEFLYVTNCAGDGFLHTDGVELTGSTYSFDSPSPQSFQERLNYLIQLNRMEPLPPMNDPALQAELQRLVEQKAQTAGWIDNPSVTIIASPEWAIYRNNLTGIVTMRRLAGIVGHRFPDGECTIQMHTFAAQATGSGFGQTNYEGSAGNIGAGCRMLDWMAGGAASSGAASSGAAAAASAGNGCTNTCRSSNDGECDDGGPGSLYNVCAFGTDCADCGPR